MTSDLDMWQQRAEAAEAEVSMLRGMKMDKRALEAAEVYATAVRLVAMASVYPDDAIGRAIAMLRDESLASLESAPDDARALDALAWALEQHTIRTASMPADDDEEWRRRLDAYRVRAVFPHSAVKP
jgi:hypothetical protein